MPRAATSPACGAKIDHVEVATPRTFEFFTQHDAGASFGTKFEGLKVSQNLPEQIDGLFHAGSVGIIMSGWLGAANYGVIVANEVDSISARREEANVRALGSAGDRHRRHARHRRGAHRGVPEPRRPGDRDLRAHDDAAAERFAGRARGASG